MFYGAAYITNNSYNYYPKIENLMSDEKKQSHTRVEYRTRNFTIEMILLNANEIMSPWRIG